jgi:LmbE family N-acetylglucosaminyl deacetylase
MAHVFVAPHPDDVALSCGGLIASLRELGQNITIITAYSGAGSVNGDSLTTYQREALGFGTKALWPVTEAFNRANLNNDYPVNPDDPSGEVLPPWSALTEQLDATQEEADQAAKRFWQRASWYRRANIHNEPIGERPLIDEQPNQGAVLTEELVEAAQAGDLMAARRLEDERYAYFAEASIVFLDLPDAVFRGYEGDAELLGSPRPDDPSPADILRREIVRLEPQKVYFPLGVGNHVDHQLVRDAGMSLLADGRRWVMPGPEWAGIVTFYEDFPYAWWHPFDQLQDLPPQTVASLPQDVSLWPQYADVSDQIERKITGLTIYQSQIERLFGKTSDMARAVRAFSARVAALGGLGGTRAERYWATTRI